MNVWLTDTLPAIGIVCNVIQGQDEAVVDIPDADLGLADRLGLKVIARRAKQDPVRVHLQPRAAENALAARPGTRVSGWAA